MPAIIKERLFTPGPTPLLMEAQARTLTATLHHRTEAFRQLVRETLENLRYFFNTENDVLILTCSGTGAMEAAISNLLSPGDRVLVGTAGKFGERWLDLAAAYGIEAVKVEAPYGHPLEMEEMAQRLASHGPFRAVFVQSTESSTGVSHDVRALGELIRELPDTCLVVDAITGLGTTDLRPDEWGLDIVIGGSQKALMVPPGLAFTSVSRKAWNQIEKSRLPRYYFDLGRERESLARGESRFTPATSLLVSLHVALRYIRQLSREKLIANAAFLAEASRAAAQVLGLKLFATASPASALTAICAPEGIDSGAIIKEMRTRFGAILANGQGSMKGKIFRLAHLGYYDAPDLFGLLAALEIVLDKLGHKVDLGSGVRAAEEVYLRHCN
jgi:aspartate aminotransferase-like enzyme